MVVDRGINAKLLLDAVTFDLYGSVRASDNCVFDWEYLQDLCGCLIAVQNEDSRSADATACYVRLAHYTVWEFLASSHISSTRVSQFAMSTDVVHREFAISILRQALSADPEGTGADWRRDREAYCLVLGCVFWSKMFLQTPEDLDLFFEFLNPSNPHYRRFRAIQIFALEHEESEMSSNFYVLALPWKFHVPQGSGMRSHMAEVLFNTRCLSMWIGDGNEAYEGLPPIGRLSQDGINQLGQQRVAGTFIKGYTTNISQLTFDTKVWEAGISQRFRLFGYLPVVAV